MNFGGGGPVLAADGSGVRKDHRRVAGSLAENPRNKGQEGKFLIEKNAADSLFKGCYLRGCFLLVVAFELFELFVFRALFVIDTQQLIDG